MCFTFIPADSPTVWMRFTPAEKIVTPPEKEDVATKEPICNEVADETLGVVQNTNEETAGLPISSVDRKSQLRGSQLAKREYQRDSIRMGKGRAMLSSLVKRLNIAQESAQEKNVERAARQMCGPNLGLASDGSEVIATTGGRCTDETVVDASVNVDLAGSQIKSSRVARRPLWRRPLWKGCRNRRLCCPKIDWLYCPSPAAGSDYLNLPQMMTSTRTRRQDRAASSQLASNFPFDSD